MTRESRHRRPSARPSHPGGRTCLLTAFLLLTPVLAVVVLLADVVRAVVS